jgi:hypothetical protein
LCEGFRTPARDTRRARHRPNGPAFENPPKKETAGDDARSSSKAYGDLKALLGGTEVPGAAS